MLKQIAERAGCSISTVSRVLNGYKTGFSVKPEMKERIQEAVKEFNYAPNPFLRSIRAKNSNVIAIFDPVSNTFASLWDAKSGFLEEISQTDYFDITKYVSLYHKESYQIPLVPAGALLFDISDPLFLDFVEESQVPYVVINGICRERGCSILFDESENVRMVMERLFRDGHRRIVFYSNHSDSGLTTMHYSGRVRENLFLDEITRLDCVRVPARFFHIKNPNQFIKTAVDEFGATAIVCNDHGCAIDMVLSGDVLRRIRSQTLSLVSLSDNFPLECGDTPISAVSNNGIAVGKIAAKALLELMEHKGKTISARKKQITLPGKLIDRKSIFPVKENTSC